MDSMDDPPGQVHGRAVQGAAVGDQRPGVYADAIPAREAGLQRGQRLAVRVPLSVLRHQHAAVQDQKVRVAGRPVRLARHRQRRQVVAPPVGAPQARQFGLQGGPCRVGQGAGGYEARRQVYVSVGVVFRQPAVPQPQEASAAQGLAQLPLQPGPVQAGIAAAGQGPVAVREQGAVSVGVYAAAFQHQGQPAQRGGAEGAGGVQPRRQRVVSLRGEAPAPAVEAKVQQYRRAAAIDCDRAVVPRPDVVRGRRVQGGPRRVYAGRREQAAHPLAAAADGACDQQAQAVRRALACDLGQRGLHARESAAPAAAAGPGQEQRRLGFPFGRQARGSAILRRLHAERPRFAHPAPVAGAGARSRRFELRPGRRRRQGLAPH